MSCAQRNFFLKLRVLEIPQFNVFICNFFNIFFSLSILLLEKLIIFFSLLHQDLAYHKSVSQHDTAPTNLQRVECVNGFTCILSSSTNLNKSSAHTLYLQMLTKNFFKGERARKQQGDSEMDVDISKFSHFFRYLNVYKHKLQQNLCYITTWVFLLYYFLNAI